LEFSEVLRRRRSTRSFTGEDVSEDEVTRLLEAACLAPSAGNIQPWFFIIIRDAESRARVCEAALNQSFIREAPVVIVACAEPGKSKRHYGARGESLFCLQDSAAAVENLLLAAADLGLGACWVGAFSEEAVKGALRIPEGLRPVAVVPVGWPAEEAGVPSRRPLGEVVRFGSF